MSLAQDCAACMMGKHNGHNRDHGITPGLIGGTYCACTGDCAEGFEAASREFASAWATAPLAAVGVPADQERNEQ